MPKPNAIPAITYTTAQEMADRKRDSVARRTNIRAKAARGNPHAKNYEPMPGMDAVNDLVQDYYSQILEEDDANQRSKKKP